MCWSRSLQVISDPRRRPAINVKQTLHWIEPVKCWKCCVGKPLRTNYRMPMRSASVHQTLDDTDADWSMRDRRAGIENVAEARNPRTFWTILRWRAPLIAALTAATVVAAGIATVVLPPKYKGTTIVLVDPRQPRVTNTEAVLAGIGADAAAVESQVELIESSSLAKRVIARLNLDQD